MEVWFHERLSARLGVVHHNVKQDSKLCSVQDLAANMLLDNHQTDQPTQAAARHRPTFLSACIGRFSKQVTRIVIVRCDKRTVYGACDLFARTDF